MNTLTSMNGIARAIRNLIRIGVVTDVDLNRGLCRVQTGGMKTTWLNWLTCRAGRSRVWWAPSEGEQVLLLAIAKKEGLDVNEQEVNAQLYQLCMRSGEDFKVREAYEKSGMIFTLRDRILADKAMDAIYAKAQVKEVEPKAAEKTEENN